MRITSLMCVIVVCLLSTKISAQVYIDLLNIGHNQHLKANYKGFDENYQQQTSWLNANVPFIFNDKGDFLMPSLQYHLTNLHHNVFEEEKLT